VLEVTLSGSNMFFIGVIGLLVDVALVAASSNGDLLGAPLWPPLIAFGCPLHAFVDGHGQCPSATNGDHLPLTLDRNGPDYLLTRGVSDGDVEKLLFRSSPNYGRVHVLEFGS
jgi:hypothetical protein